MSTLLPVYPQKIAANHRQATNQKANTTRNYITELLVSKYCDDYLSLLLPMLGHQARVNGGRWISWISPARIDKSLLQEFSVDAHKVRFVYPKQQQDLFDLTHKALVAGTSHCVVVVSDFFTPEQLAALNTAAKFGNTMALVVSRREDV